MTTNCVYCENCGNYYLECECVKIGKLVPQAERPGPGGLAASTGSLPRRPWIASNQYGMHFLLSADNEVLWRADMIPMETLRAMVKTANEQLAANSRISDDGTGTSQP